jgi:hypothetical protein
MSTIATPIKKEVPEITATENKKRIENHKKAANHLETAAERHLEAAKHCEAGNHDKACASTLKAHGHMALARETQKEDLKNHAAVN